jgi:hypothetical protein
MNLYDIDQRILDCIDAETGEIFDYEAFEALNIERDAKIENVLLWIKNLKAQAAALQAEKLNFAQRQKVCENQIERLETYIIEVLGGNKWESAKVKASFRKSEKLKLSENAVVPEEFKKPKFDVDVTGLKQPLKAGESLTVSQSKPTKIYKSNKEYTKWN